jgi:lysophospholipase L1-like esterase
MGVPIHQVIRLTAMAVLAIAVALGLIAPGEAGARAKAVPAKQKWVTVWAASAQGPYPFGNPSAQPEQKFAFPEPAAGAEDQSFRMIVHPGLWGSRARLRFSNAFGRQALLLDHVYLGLQRYAGNLIGGTNRLVTFGGQSSVSIPAGAWMWSDAIDLNFVRKSAAEHLDGRKLAVSFHVAGQSGPMTWHAKALQTSYVSAPKSGVHSREENDTAFIYSTASWFFLDALDVMAPADTAVVVCFGDSITDGTASTMNGDDRWPDVLAQRVREQYDSRVVVVNAGIGGNRVVGPADYAQSPIPGGPGALDRLERDVLSLSSVQTVIWMEGINDYGAAGASVETVTVGYRTGIERMRAKGIKVVGATLTSGLNSTIKTHGTEEVDAKRKETNEFIRRSGVFDAVADFDAATIDSATGEIKPEMQPNSTIGGAGDKLHPNRAGYQAMGQTVDLSLLAPRSRPAPATR